MTVLMRGHNINFNTEIWKIIPKLSLLSLFIWSTEYNNKRNTDYTYRQSCLKISGSMSGTCIGLFGSAGIEPLNMV